MTGPTLPVPLLPLGDRLMAIAKILQDCLCERLKTTAAGPVCRCAIVAGQNAIADVCSKQDDPPGDGQAWIRLAGLFRTVNFPNPVLAPSCGTAYVAATFEAGVLRCGSTVQEDGQPPEVDAQFVDAVKVLDDISVLESLDCCLPYPLKWVSQAWTPMSGGGCTGGTVTIQILLVPGPLSSRKAGS